MEVHFKEMVLKSGAKLRITMAPFAEGKALFDSILEESRTLTADPRFEVDPNLMKDIFCALLSSKRIEPHIWKVMERSLYNGLKITPDTFEPLAARQDFLEVYWEVGQFNVLPFGRNLWEKWSPLVQQALKNPEWSFRTIISSFISDYASGGTHAQSKKPVS